MVNVNPIETIPVLRRHREEVYATTDQIAVEMPVAFVYNGVSHAVMMASPANLDDFALGFSLTEGIIETSGELYSLEVISTDIGIEIHMKISQRCFQLLKQKRRTLMGQTGCGICGTESLQAFRQLPAPVAVRKKTTANTISKAISLLPQQQSLNQMTGATHAAAWATLGGDIIQVREDVGRHNALDKLIGTQIQNKHPDGFLLITSRASYEMVLKTAKAGISILVAISAPTSLAITVADKLNITLLGFTRNERFVVYTHQTGICNL